MSKQSGALIVQCDAWITVENEIRFQQFVSNITAIKEDCLGV